MSCLKETCKVEPRIIVYFNDSLLRKKRGLIREFMIKWQKNNSKRSLQADKYRVAREILFCTRCTKSTSFPRKT